MLLAGALRVYELDYQSLWSDEVISLKTTDPALSLREFWDKVLADTHPPIYYLVPSRFVLELDRKSVV